MAGVVECHLLVDLGCQLGVTIVTLGLDLGLLELGADGSVRSESETGDVPVVVVDVHAVVPECHETGHLEACEV